MASQQPSTFSLHTRHQSSLGEFQTRSKDVFGSLESLEKNYDDGVKTRGPDLLLDDDDDRREDDRDGGTAFKRPAPPRYGNGRSRRDHRRDWDGSSQDGPRWRTGASGSSGREGHYQGGNRKHHTPDHQVHPENWTRYSLEDTDVSGHSTNKRAAIDFFRDLREQKAKEKDIGEQGDDLECEKIEFKKPVTKADKEEDVGKKNSYSDVHKMPEYIIGQTKTKPMRKRCAPTSSPVCQTESTISLGHLEEEDDVNQSKYKMKRQSDLNQSEDSDSKSGQSESKPVTVSYDSSQSGVRGGFSSGSSDQSNEVSSSGSVDESERKQGMGFQKKKGKGKRQIRGRREEDGDN